MNNDNEKDPYIQVVENFMNFPDVIKTLKDKIANDSDKYKEDLYLDKKKDLLDNLNIANRMFEKYSNIILQDIDLKARAEDIYKKLEKIFN